MANWWPAVWPQFSHLCWNPRRMQPSNKLALLCWQRWLVRQHRWSLHMLWLHRLQDKQRWECSEEVLESTNYSTWRNSIWVLLLCTPNFPDCCNTIEVTQGGSSAAYQAQPQIFTTYTLQSSTDGRVQYRSSSGYEYLQFGSEKNWEFQDYGGNKAYTPYSSWCPHDAGLTWYYWSGSTWVSAGDGIQVTCTSSKWEHSLCV